MGDNGQTRNQRLRYQLRLISGDVDLKAVLAFA